MYSDHSRTIQWIIPDICVEKSLLAHERIIRDTGLYQTGDYARLVTVVSCWSCVLREYPLQNMGSGPFQIIPTPKGPHNGLILSLNDS